MLTSDSNVNLFKSLIAASTELGNVAKTKQAFGYKYAPFDSIVDMLRLTLPKHHLWFTQDVSNEGDKYVLETLVLHDSGEWLKSKMVMTDTEMNKCNATQQLGASITYFKRYILSAIFGIATDEDVDGNIETAARKQEIKANVKAAKRTEDEKPKSEFIEKVNEMHRAAEERESAQKARDYTTNDMRNRLESGASADSIKKLYADMLKTDEQRSPESIPDNEIIILGRELYKLNSRKK